MKGEINSLSKLERRRAHTYAKKMTEPPKTIVGSILVEIMKTATAEASRLKYGFFASDTSIEGRIAQNTYWDLYRDYGRQMQYLKRKRQIMLEKDGNRLSLSLTDDGYLIALRLAMINESNMLPKGELCLVVFDIPESARNTRRRLRLFLKSVGFSRLQQSVWATRKDVTKYMSAWIVAGKHHRQVRVFRAIP